MICGGVAHDSLSAILPCYAYRKQIHLFREWAADQLVSLVRNPHIPKQEAWVMSVTRFLFIHAFYRQSRAIEDSKVPELARAAPSPALTQQTHDMCAQRVFSVLGELSSWSPSVTEGEATPAAAPDANGENAHRSFSHALDGTPACLWLGCRPSSMWLVAGISILVDRSLACLSN